MPFSRARSATALPTAAAASLLPVYFQLFSDSFFYSRSSYQNFKNHSVQLPVRKCDAGYDVPPGELRSSSWSLRRAPGRTTDTSRFLIHSVTLLLLSLFGTHDFVGVTNTLRFVRLTGRR